MNGILTDFERAQLQALHVDVLKVAQIIFHRLTMSEMAQRDSHSNSWWRHYDRDLNTTIVGIIHKYAKYKAKKQPRTIEESERQIDEVLSSS